MTSNSFALPEPVNAVKNTVLRVVGVACAAIGAIGLVLPLLPGTPFLLLSALCFSAIN